MAEANPSEGTSTLSTAQAVDLLLNPQPPVEDQAESEEPIAEEEIEASEADEAFEAEEGEELEATSEDIEDDDIEDDEVEDEPQDAEPTYRVRAGEEELDVTLDELRNSYMRQSDYTRKTQQVAEDRKALEAELETLSGAREQYANNLAFLQQALSMQEQPPEYWNALKVNDPDRYTAERAAMTERNEAMENVNKELARVQNEQVEAMKAAAAERMQAEASRLPEIIPEWSDPGVAEKEKEALIPYLQKAGYTAQELQNVSDSRAIMLSRKAMLYDRLMEGKPVAQKKTRKAPKMTRSGQPQSKKQVSQRRRQKAFANIGKQRGRASVDAAVDYLLTK